MDFYAPGVRSAVSGQISVVSGGISKDFGKPERSRDPERRREPHRVSESRRVPGGVSESPRDCHASVALKLFHIHVRQHHS